MSKIDTSATEHSYYHYTGQIFYVMLLENERGFQHSKECVIWIPNAEAVKVQFSKGG